MSACRSHQPSVYPMYAVLVCYFYVFTTLNFGQDNLVYNKLCYQEYSNETLCENSTFTKTDVKLQEQAGKWSNYITSVQIVPVILSNILLSSYCDRVGHKLPLLLSVSGLFFSHAWLLVCSLHQLRNWPMYALLLTPFINGVSGSYAMVRDMNALIAVQLVMSACSYVSLVSKDNRRAFVLAVSEASIQLGMLSGTTSAGPIIDNVGQTVYFAICLGVALVSLVITLFLVVDIKKEEYHSFKMINLFNLERIKQAVQCMFRRRTGIKRMLLHVTFAVFFICYFASCATTAISYLYFVKGFGMTLTHYSIFSGVMLGSRMIAMPLSVELLTRFFKTDLLTNVVIGITSQALGLIFFSIRSSEYFFWIGIATSIVQGIVNAMFRAYQYDLVEKDEVGRLFAYSALLQITMDLIAQLCIKTLYIWTVDWWPGFLMSFLAGVVIVALMIMIILKRLDLKHREILANSEHQPLLTNDLS